MRKPNGFTSIQLNLVEGAGAPRDSYVVLALDRREAGIGVIKGTHLQILPTIESGITGKMYQESKKGGSNYFEKIADALAVVYPPNAKVFVLGPGTTKDAFVNYLLRERKDCRTAPVLRPPVQNCSKPGPGTANTSMTDAP